MQQCFTRIWDFTWMVYNCEELVGEVAYRGWFERTCGEY